MTPPPPVPVDSPANMDIPNPSQGNGADYDKSPEMKEKLGKAFTDLIAKFDNEDRVVRERYLRLFKKHEFYWNGIHDIVWDSRSREWVTVAGALQRVQDPDINPEDYDKLLNVYRAHGESICAAIASHIPNQVFFPENADSDVDIEAAKGYTNLAKKIAQDNDVDLRYIEIAQCMYNYGIAAVYNDFVQSPEYGFTERPLIGMEMQNFQDFNCPDCGENLGGGEPQQCPGCGGIVQPEMNESQEEVPAVKDILKDPNGREVIRVYTPLEVSVPHYVKYAADIPYVCLETEIHLSKMKSMFPELDKKLGEASQAVGEYGRRFRLDFDAITASVATVRQCWFANWTYEHITGNEEVKAYLQEHYPDGAYCVFINNIFVDCMNEDMHAHWTFPESPTSRRLYSLPIGALEMPVQDMVSTLTDLTMETVEQGVPQTFADPSVFDFKKYREGRQVVGGVYPVKSTYPGRGLDQAFFQMKTATLSQEVEPFRQYLDYMGQFLTGDFPSIFGGTIEGSRTLGEYNASQSQAMQRLSIVARICSKLWSMVIRKAVIDMKERMKDDQHFVQRIGNSFLNVWIRKEQLTGNVGRVEPETSDMFPLTEAQRREILVQLMNKGNDALLKYFMHPENIGYAFRLMGFSELFIPGDRDRNKELATIQDLLNAQPIPDPMTGQMMPSIPIDKEFDDNVACIQTCRAWLTSEVGLMNRETNPGGFQNVIAHLMMHMTAEAQNAQMQAPPDSGGPPPGGAPPGGPESV